MSKNESIKKYAEFIDLKLSLKEDNNIDIFLKQCFPKCSSALASVTRLGNFLKVLGANFGAKAGQIFSYF